MTLNVKESLVVIMTRDKDNKEYVIRMDVISIHIEWVIKISMDLELHLKLIQLNPLKLLHSLLLPMVPIMVVWSK